MGKPIKGNGAIQIGYFTQRLILAAIFAVAWMIVRIIAIFNAPVAVGLKTVEGGSHVIGDFRFGIFDLVEKELCAALMWLFFNRQSAFLIRHSLDAHRASHSRDVQRTVVGLKG